MAKGNYAKGALRREEILDATLHTIAKDGYNAVTIRSVAEQAGLSKTGVVHHFASKQELLTAALSRRDDWGAMDRGPAEVGTFFDRLWTALTGEVAAAGLVELYVRLSAEATHPDDAAHGFFVSRYQHSQGEGSDIWRKLQDIGRAPRSVDPETLSILMMAILDGLQLRLLYEPSLDIGSVVDALQVLIEAAGAVETADDDLAHGST